MQTDSLAPAAPRFTRASARRASLLAAARHAHRPRPRRGETMGMWLLLLAFMAVMAIGVLVYVSA